MLYSSPESYSLPFLTQAQERNTAVWLISLHEKKINTNKFRVFPDTHKREMGWDKTVIFFARHFKNKYADCRRKNSVKSQGSGPEPHSFQSAV